MRSFETQDLKSFRMCSSKKTGVAGRWPSLKFAADPARRRELILCSERGLDGGKVRQQLHQPSDLQHCHSLSRQTRDRKRLSNIAPVDKEGYQRPNSSRIQKRHPAHIEHQVSRRLRTQRLNEVVNRLETQFSIEPGHEITFVR